MTAKLYVFPPSRRVPLVQRITDVGMRKPTLDQRERYWYQRRAALEKDLARLGFSDAEIRQAVGDLWRGVRREFERRRKIAHAGDIKSAEGEDR